MLELSVTPGMMWTGGSILYALLGIMVGRSYARKLEWTKEDYGYADGGEALGMFLGTVCIVAFWPLVSGGHLLGKLIIPAKKKETKK